MKSWIFKAGLAGVVLAKGVLGADILETVGFSNCNGTAAVSVQRVNIKYNNEDKSVTFDVAGSSSQIQNVTAVLNVTAYGQNIYSKAFDPCDAATFVDQLCPVPAGTFSAKGTQKIPEEFANLVPAIAFQIPDIAAMATLQLQSKESGERVACLEAQVSNGKTAVVPAVSYVAAGVAGAALIMSGISAAGAAFSGASAAASGATAGGMGTISPSFTEVFGWFQGMAMNGMMSVNYPNVYRSFAQNFGFSTGLVPWTQMQLSIDQFRNMTGGNLTEDSVEFLKGATLVYPDGSSSTPSGSALVKRAFDNFVYLARRQIEGIETSVNTTEPGVTPEGGAPTETIRVAVTGMQAYVQELSVPKSNTFMTVLLVVALVIAVIVVGVLLVKIILEFWALFGSFPKSLLGFRKRYWGSIGRAITHLILLLYGVWVLYCVFQFTNGDSWAAKTLAGITLFLFTGILAFFSFNIWRTARRLKKHEGDVAGLYDDKNIWVKYSLFYESYRKGCWWIFVPTIVYMFAKGFALAATDGNGMVQTSAQLIIEGVMLIVLIWSRPYERKSSNVVNITIQVVRVLSVVCIFVFVEQFGIAQTTQTVAGVVLIAVQSALTGILAILIAWNAISACCKKNPHRQRRKEMEKMQRDTLTPLDARNSLLLDREKTTQSDLTDSFSLLKTGAPLGTVDTKQSHTRSESSASSRYTPPPAQAQPQHTRDGSNDSAFFRNMRESRQPRLPISVNGTVYHSSPYGGGNMGYGGGGYGPGGGYGYRG